MKIDFARWNHVLVPATKAERDRYRNGRLARVARPLVSRLYRISREGRVLATMGFAVAAFGVDVGRTDAHLLLLSALAIFVASLGFSAFYALTGVTIAASSPRRVAVGEELTISVTLENKGDRAHSAIRIDQPLLPWDGRWTGAPPSIVELLPGKTATTFVTARFLARGEHHVDPVGAAALVPLGLAQGERVRSDGVRFLVVPKIARVLRVTTPRNRRHQPGGVARASKTGDATDLLGVRPYRPGDPVRDLHARSWARLGFPVVREYQEEYFTRVGVVLDTDKTAADEESFEAALSLSAGVIASLCRGETLVDVLVVGERVHDLSIGRSLGTIDQALDVLASVEPGPALATNALLARLGPHLERLSSVVVITLSWDAARRDLVGAIRRRGVGCAALVVGESTARDGDARFVPRAAIERGEALSL